MSHPSDEEGVGVGVATDVIDVALADVGEVADAECESAQRQVYGELVAKRGRIEGGGKADVVVSVAEGEEFVVALPIGRGEHRPQQGNVYLITKDDGLASEVERVEHRSRSRKPDCSGGLCWVVAVAGVVESAKGGS